MPSPTVLTPSSSHPDLPERDPRIGEMVRVRTRRWLVEDVTPAPNPGESSRIRLACADDDAQGQELEVFWKYELDRAILDDEPWSDLGERGFDRPDQFAAFLNTLRWSCTTATDPSLFQAPFRAGIKIEAYQMEPLRKALRLPRVNLFIADDTGLGKTIEAGLIVRELLLRRKVRTIVVAAPPSVLEQWKAEMEERFGIIFEILDRQYLARIRRERGFGTNPWSTHSRFLVSHRLLADPTYADPMRAWLGEMRPGSLLVLDEAHHAAPSHGGRYGIESKFTRAVRDLCNRFEHRLFLSATPHNGHSNSFSTLLELLDPHRFTRGVKIRGKADLEAVMVRRLKEDIRAEVGGFPKRDVKPVIIDGLPEDAPELVLSRLLDDYRNLRDRRFANATARGRAAAGLLVVGLQQRLLSSIEAFARSLKRHRETVERHWAKEAEAIKVQAVRDRRASVDAGFLTTTGADDDFPDGAGAGTESEEDRDLAADAEATEAAEEELQIEAANREAEGELPKDATAEQIWQEELRLLDRMQEVAEVARTQPDHKTHRLIDWIRENLCPGLPAYGLPVVGELPQWNDRRVLVFTENREGTKRFLKKALESAIEGTDRADERIEVIDGLTSGPRRKEVQRRFNTPPDRDPLRILLATDAAREGLNFQAHCADLFHFDLPWNPGRIEQRNGRIDRKLQPVDVVRCHYFKLPQRHEDRVLEVLVRKTGTIRRELGSLGKVIDEDIGRRLKGGIRRRDAAALATELKNLDLNADRKRVVAEEFEPVRERQRALQVQIEKCRHLLERSRNWVRFQPEAFRRALSCSLSIQRAGRLKQERDERGRSVWRFPELDGRVASDPSWAATLDTLRVPIKRGQKRLEWRKEAPIRPVVFKDAGELTEDVVHLHLEQRVAQRLLARFRAQGFVHHDLSRACLAHVADSVRRVVLLGRLSLYGERAERLHEEIVTVTAPWKEPHRRSGPLTRYALDAERRTLALLDRLLKAGRRSQPSETVRRRLLASAERDVAELRPQLEPRASELAQRAAQKLRDRGEREAKELHETLSRQRDRVEAELARHEAQTTQLALDLDAADKRQLEANKRSWRNRLGQFERDLVREPDRIRRFYRVRASRVEPVGLVYLWPETG
ncbi:MAG: DISARM system SNF2-like helicase DrmD [Gammaproteobacteria bacterium]|nr:DISARM system SNF2-like helicase DrmD [Gammaproteobacteria bacterium]MDE0258738.1 DISARM system SNF2-like helicase DrmD [Gammaproteobacteria bacterium]